jgi:hypothetical protein
VTGERFPRFVDAIGNTHESKVVHWFRLGIDMGTITERLQKTPEGRAISVSTTALIAEYNAKHKS